jgi:16S rRNA C967 or C1407 C5-methylase (RsmB/RsmF family)/NOL1/NOP2/fmu family ribosome biogenesis protein
MRSQLGTQAALLLDALSTSTPISIRTNPAKSVASISENLENVPWCETGYYLPERPIFTLDPLLHAGAYYVQEAGSMFLSKVLDKVLNINEKQIVLDLCAAPGGKSSLIASKLNSDSLLVANEVIKKRVEILKENLTKWGFPNIVYTNHYAEELGRMPSFYDIILVDAPCSGEGMFRKDPKSVEHWSLEAVQSCAMRQQNIVSEIMATLKNQGYVIYSTCTYNDSENIDNIVQFCSESPLISVDIGNFDHWGITKIEKGNCIGYQFFPHKTRSEGFFVSIMQKSGDPVVPTLAAQAPKYLQKISKSEEDSMQLFVANSHDYHFYKREDNDVVALRKSIEKEYFSLFLNLQKRSTGLVIGQFKGKDFIPSPELALSIVHPDLPYIEVDKETALLYLKKESFPIDRNLKGWLLIRYEGQNLGWIKAVQGRCNNYYPGEWRIRMEIGVN